MFEFTGAAGAVTTIDTFAMVVVNPCPIDSTKLTLVNPIADQTFTFFNNRASIKVPYDVQNLAMSGL